MNPREPVNSLTGLRAVAAYSVLIAHIISWTAARADPSWQPIAERIAYFGISLFFVLSGFVIQYNYATSLASGGWRGTYNFIIARFARLYPLYAAVLGYGFWLGGGVPYLDRPDIVISHMTLTQSWIGTFRAYLPAAWTISTEWFFYLVFIPLAPLFLGVQRPGRALLVFLICAMAGLGTLFHYHLLVVSALTSVPGWLNHGDLSANPWDWLIYYSPLVRIFEFFVGCLCARLYTPGECLLPIPGILAGVAIGWCAIVIAWGDSLGSDIGPLLPNFIFAPALSVLVLYSCRRNILSYILSSRIASFGGEISYSVYLTQGFIVGRVFASGGGALKAVVAVTLVSTITWLLIEWPFRYLLRKLTVARPTIPMEPMGAVSRSK